LPEHLSPALLDPPPGEDATPPAFHLQSASFAYADGTPALRDITLRIGQGEKVAVLGANGSGKSTLLRLLDGLHFAASGRVEAFGLEVSERALRSPAHSARLRRRVGFVFQNPDAQLFSTTARDEIAFGPLQLGLPAAEIERRIADVAALLEIGHLLDRPPFRLSGGEKKKVAVASVLAAGPDAILLDEPLGGLDPRSQRGMVDLFVRLHRAGKTLVTATHDLTAVAELADRVVVLNEEHGLEAEGPAGTVLGDLELLTRVNLIHEHLHWHGDLCHSHPHFHDHDHTHEHP